MTKSKAIKKFLSTIQFPKIHMKTFISICAAVVLVVVSSSLFIATHTKAGEGQSIAQKLQASKQAHEEAITESCRLVGRLTAECYSELSPESCDKLGKAEQEHLKAFDAATYDQCFMRGNKTKFVAPVYEEGYSIPEEEEQGNSDGSYGTL